MRKLANFFGILFLASAVFLVFLIFVFGAAQTPFGKRQLALVLSRVLSSPTIETHVGRIEGIVPFQFKISEVISRQDNAAWLVAKNISCSIAPALQQRSLRSKLPRVVIRINELVAEQAAVLKIPRWDSHSPFKIVGIWPSITAQKLAINQLILPTGTNNNELSLEAKLTGDRESWHLFLHCNNRATNAWCEANLAFLVNSQTIAGNIDSSISELDQLVNCLHGSLDTNIKFANIGNNQTVTASVQANNLRTANACLAKLSLQIDISDAWHEPAGQLQIAITDLVQENIYLSNANINLSGSPQAILWRTDLAGQLYGFPFGATANAHGYLAKDKSGAITIDDFQGSYADQTVSINEPENISWENNQYQWDKVRFQIGTNGYLETAGTISTQDVSVALNAFLPFSLSSIFKRSQLTGSAALEILLQGSPLHPTGKAIFHAQTDKPTILTDLKEKSWSADITAKLEKNHLDIEATSSGMEELSFDCKASLPVQLTLQPFQCTMVSAQPLSASLQANFNFNLLAPLLAAHQQYLQGQLETDATLTGTWLHPALHGHATITNASYQYLLSGTVIDKANIRLEANNEHIQIKEAQATDGLKGHLAASGQLKFDPTANFPFSFTLSATNATLVRMDYNNAKLNSVLQASGNSKHISVTGAINIVEANINIPRALPPSITPIPVKIINAPTEYPAELMSNELEEDAANVVDLLLTINAPGHIYIKGRGLYSEWAGSLSIKGHLNKPLIRGQLSTINGYFMFLGKKLNLQQCVVSLNGTYPFTPQINLNAQTEIDNMVANLQIVGSLANPALTISSSPAYPQQEILARLLFGKSLSEVTPLETVRILYGLAILQGGTPLTTTIDKAQEFLHIDQIALTQTKHDQPAMIVSKNFGRLQIAGTTSLKGTNTDVQVSYDITPTLQAEATAGLESGNGLYFRWHRDY